MLICLETYKGVLFLNPEKPFCSCDQFLPHEEKNCIHFDLLEILQRKGIEFKKKEYDSTHEFYYILSVSLHGMLDKNQSREGQACSIKSLFS